MYFSDKSADFSSSKAYFIKLFEGEMTIRTESKTLFEIFFIFMLNSKVIYNSILCPDYTGQKNTRQE